MRSSPNVLSKALSLVTAVLCCVLWLGMSALAAGLPVEVSVQLTENTVAVTGTVQDDAVTRIGVLILNKDADLDHPVCRHRLCQRVRAGRGKGFLL